jgi:alanine dehydrogenase
MNLGIPKEVRDFEQRVGLTPAGVFALTSAGHRVYIEHDAGAAAGFGDDDYRNVGAEVLYSAEEVYGRTEVIAKVARLTEKEYPCLRAGQTIFSWMHLAVASRDLAETLKDCRITAIAYELIRADDGSLPVLAAASTVAGRMAPIIAGPLLESAGGGRGILLSGIPGVPPAAVVIIGAGVVGTNATRAFIGVGAQVTVLDNNYGKLEVVDREFDGRATTLLATRYNLDRVLRFADVVVGAVLVPGQRAPVLLTRKMIRTMRPRAVFIDFSIDQGGCAETSRLTTHRDPTYVEEGVIHYCVPNITARVARTASHALTNASLPHLLEIGARGVEGALEADVSLRRGVQVRAGKIQE